MLRSHAVHLARMILLAAFMTGCTTAGPAPRVIRDANELLVRLEPAQACDRSGEGPPFSHPIRLSGEQIRTLLRSLLAREKVGLLSSFIDAPGTPRLLHDADLDGLTAPIQEAFAQATPQEVVVFMLTTPAADSRSTVTSGALSIRGDVLSIDLFNFRHPVRTTLSDVGATDRLSDVRETLQYARQSPCVSIGEQDFALFFEEPTYQTQTRSGSLIRYPERALSIAYSSFLATPSQAIPRTADTENRRSRASHERTERQTIEDLTRRINELEQTNQTLAAQARNNTPLATPVDAQESGISDTADRGGETQQRLLDLIQQLELRISNLERHRQSSPAP